MDKGEKLVESLMDSPPKVMGSNGKLLFVCRGLDATPWAVDFEVCAVVHVARVAKDGPANSAFDCPEINLGIFPGGWYSETCLCSVIFPLQ